MRRGVAARRSVGVLAAVATAVGTLVPAGGAVAFHSRLSAPATTRSSTGSIGATAPNLGFSQGSPLLWESAADQAADLDGIARSGARWVGADFDWPSAEPVRGSYDWSAIDRLVGAASVRGLRVMAAVVYTPAWARPPGTTDKTPPTDPSAIAGFLTAAVRRYAPLGVRAWQIWNEPNVKMFWESGPDPARFTALLRVASRAIHAADPSATVIAGGLAPAGNVPGQEMAPLTFLSRMYAAGARGSFDALGLHPYSFPYAATTPATWNPFYMLPWFNATMAKYGDGAKRIWATEVGFGTGTDRASVTESTQAARILEVLRAWKRYSFTGPVFLYSYRDLSATSGYVFDRMGLTRADGSPKPAYYALRSFVARSQPRRTRSCPLRVCLNARFGRR